MGSALSQTKTNARLKRNALNRSRKRKTPFFFNLFVQIFGRIRTVVGRGCFSLAISHCENVASARRVLIKRKKERFVFPSKAFLSKIWILNPIMSKNSKRKIDEIHDSKLLTMGYVAWMTILVDYLCLLIIRLIVSPGESWSIVEGWGWNPIKSSEPSAPIKRSP